MARLSPEEQATLKRLQQRAEAPDDEETAVWVRNASGHETRLTGERAERWLARNGYSEDEAEESTAAEPLESAGKGVPKKAAKKAAAPKKAVPPADDADIPGEDGEDLDDVPPTPSRRAFF